MTREQYCAVKKQEREEEAKQQRKLVQNRRDNPKHSKIYGILGVDSLVPHDEIT